MNRAKLVASFLTEDPDLILENKSRLIIAVHPNFVINAVVQAASKHAETQEYAKKRLEIFQNYLDKFEKFLRSRVRNSNIIVTKLNREPEALKMWYDPKHDVQMDPIEAGQEQEQAFQLYQNLEDLLNELRLNDNVFFFEEDEAGSACNSPKLQKILNQASSIEIIGGNLTGCLIQMVERVSELSNVDIRVVEALTFDDDVDFWGRVS